MTAREWTEAERAARQAGLGIETHGETLTRQEIEFCEKFLALGHTPEWIKRRIHFPTNDFIWRDFGNREFELKTTKARYLTIHGRIVDAASRAANHGFVKENFLIDIGDAPLTADLEADLSGINVGMSQARISQLWVMSQGQLHEIRLTA
ncbi:MAG: hypothetical protein FWF75_00520 [Propionibacteriaceae bacterium]|nr:hypothetical protein [Propionibacteriaceae bacterium]